MALSITNISWPAVAAATLAYFFLGAFWFSPFVCGKLYDRALGFERPANFVWTPIYYVGPFFGCLAVALAVGVVLPALQPASLLEAIVFGLVAGLGFSTSVSFVNSITPKMAQPLLFGAVTGVYHVLGVTIAAMIVYAMLA